ncbi:MAG: 4-hydroxyphenylpyruvate dioxygenase [Bacteroidota bacterium]|nr:4-hydroxyphenylpyruvate dioxygenase [Bacteroidota bacterium]MDP4233472.1 4-hydroxyphenylpyruvate dioxygenase [Bacteroidota bacterium]MDP4243350.1 4-hydroxyphenylpyruvate dioxygenase [Bacteroidota bacterium]MDP4287964.1 4-hydroxyphenylpyruvate dioxygenase [Bacteroidota bacterium]
MPNELSPAPIAVSNSAEQDFFPIRAIDHLEFVVGNAKQSAYYYRSAFGFKLTAYAGLETGVRDRASYVLEQGKIRFVLTTPLLPEHPYQDHLAMHGDGVRDISLEVDDVERAYSETTKRGAVGIQEPREVSDENGTYRTAAIKTYGDTLHSFVDRKNYRGFAPGYRAIASEDTIARPTGLAAVDHVVGNVGWNQMNDWVKWYEDVMGFHLFVSFDDKDISTEYSALMSKVVASGSEKIKFPINEPATGRKKSQIEEYVEWYRGPGVQHIALATGNIIEAVSKLSAQGVDFLRVPSSYYRELQDRVGKINEPVEQLEALGILVDRDDDGYMLQIFTKPAQDRPTVFFEIIQRRGARSFGKGNFKALFESIEREQELRGNL